VPTKQGDVALLDVPVAQELLRDRVPARLAYVWPDGTPRVVPINFHWNGARHVLGTGRDFPKIKALRQNPKVAVTIDTETYPHKVLLIRSTAAVEPMDRVPEEYAAAAYRMLGDEGGRAWLDQIEAIDFTAWARAAITPEWVGILDFERRFPNGLERAVEAARRRGAGRPAGQ
jgi:hypothetical protein